MIWTIMLVLLISGETPLRVFKSSQRSEGEWGGREQSKLTWDAQAHGKVRQESWAGAPPCLCRDKEIVISQLKWFCWCSQADERRTVIFLWLGPSYCFWSWMDPRKGTQSSNHTHLSSSLSWCLRLEGGEEVRDGFPETLKFPAFVIGAVNVECLYSPLFNLRMQ